jgi:hypothetical protein
MTKNNISIFLLLVQFLPFAMHYKYGDGGFWTLLPIIFIFTVACTLFMYKDLDLSRYNNNRVESQKYNEILMERFWFMIFGLVINLFIFTLT